MESWHKILVLLCFYGTFKEIRPSESYLTEYLEGPWINLTSSQVNHEVYPIWTYSYLPFLLVVLLVTDLLRYKLILIIGGLAYVTTWSLLLFTRSLLSMQLMQAIYGIATSTEVAYYTYIYSLVPKDAFQTVTSFTRAALLLGRFISGISSQLLISTGVMDFYSLNYISFICVSVAFFLAIVLPKPKKSIYQVEMLSSKGCCNIQCKKILQYMFYELKKCYSDRNLFLWSLWWAFATSGNVQVGNYIQPLWENIEPTWTTSNRTTTDSLLNYNGAVEAAHTLLSSIATLGLSMVQIHFVKFSEAILGTLTFIDCLLLLIMARTTHLWVAYISYVAFRTTYQMMITIVSYNVAKSIAPDIHGLIFGVNTFLALLIQTLMTILFVDKKGLHLEPQPQFIMYCLYFGILAGVITVAGLYKYYRLHCSSLRKSSISSEYNLNENLRDQT